jgi:hypothetical protein
MAAEDTSRVMHENVVLIGEINELRRELELAHLSGRKLESALTHTTKLSAMRGVTVPGLEQLNGTTDADSSITQNLERVVDLQKTEIRKLRSAMNTLEATQRDRPPSQGHRLEPLVA